MPSKTLISWFRCVWLGSDLRSKFCHLLPLKAILTAMETAELMFTSGSRYFGISEDIISHRAPQFILLHQHTAGLTTFHCVLCYQPPMFLLTGELYNFPVVDHWFQERRRVWDTALYHLLSASQIPVSPTLSLAFQIFHFEDRSPGFHRHTPFLSTGGKGGLFFIMLYGGNRNRRVIWIALHRRAVQLPRSGPLVPGEKEALGLISLSFAERLADSCRSNVIWARGMIFRLHLPCRMLIHWPLHHRQGSKASFMWIPAPSTVHI